MVDKPMQQNIADEFSVIPDQVRGKLWIRNPWWDATWVLSGMPIGLLLLCLLTLMPAATIALALIIVLDTGHLLSPMILAWSHDGLRPVMLQRSIKYIVIPIAVLLGTMALGIAGSVIFTDFHPHIGLSLSVRVDHAKDYLNPFVMMLVAYAVWNAYHFAKQNFGVLSIYRTKAGCHDTVQRHIDLIFCFTIIGAATSLAFVQRLPLSPGFVQATYGAIAVVATLFMLWRERLAETFSLPRTLFIFTMASALILIFFQGMWGFAIIAVNHWLVAIGLSSHVYSVHRSRPPVVFTAVLIAAGILTFVLLFVSLPTFTIKMTTLAVGLRVGLGFVHFLYDRWIYKLTDTKVRSTIGRDIFCLQHSPIPSLELREFPCPAV